MARSRSRRGGWPARGRAGGGRLWLRSTRLLPSVGPPGQKLSLTQLVLCCSHSLLGSCGELVRGQGQGWAGGRPQRAPLALLLVRCSRGCAAPPSRAKGWSQKASARVGAEGQETGGRTRTLLLGDCAAAGPGSAWSAGGEPSAPSAPASPAARRGFVIAGLIDTTTKPPEVISRNMTAGAQLGSGLGPNPLPPRCTGPGGWVSSLRRLASARPLPCTPSRHDGGTAWLAAE